MVNPGVLQKACQEGDERIQDCSYKTPPESEEHGHVSWLSQSEPSASDCTVRTTAVTVTSVCAATAF